jgi:pseudaminic acid biosynthesis-associated methylase
MSHNQSPTHQMKVWQDQFGKEYTERSVFSPKGLDWEYQATWGVTRTAMNADFLQGVEQDGCILEVGCNVGNQLLCLQSMGFTRLYGIEIQAYAVEKAKSRSQDINIIQGSAFDLPFRDAYFDLVFTSGVLIHLNPSDLPKALGEIHRCSRHFIWGFEYFAERFTEVRYRGQENMLWKGDYSGAYQRQFPNLRLIKEKRLRYLANENVDSMFLLAKSLT